jgi:outer membrane protein OmpA-like peptidoglycan-associated protein
VLKMRSIVLTLLLFPFLVPQLAAQDKKAFKSQFLEAEYFFIIGEFSEARFIYSELLNEDTGNANLEFLIGACCLSIDGEKKKAIPHLEKAVESISVGYREGSYKEKNAPKESLFALARAYHIQNQLDNAIEYYEKYHNIMKLQDPAQIDFVLKQIQSCKLAEIMLKNPLPYTRTPFSSDINAYASNFNAVMAQEDSTMIYMRLKPFSNVIMMTHLINGIWTKPTSINDELGIGNQSNICSISADGSLLFMSVGEDEVSLKAGENQAYDIFVSKFKKGKWSKAEKLNDNINTWYNETHASISHDSKKLFFTSDRPGGKGAMDIYVSEWQNEKDGWGVAKNLGEPVNSVYSEETPFISDNGKILYFSSMGHATMGGFDVFYSSFLPNGNWSYPANIGYPVSSCDDDLFYYPLGNGQQALFSGFMDEGEGKQKVSLLNLDTVSSLKNIAVLGTIKLDDNIQELDSSFKIKITGGAFKDSIVTVNPDQTTGEYKINLEPGTYQLRTEGQGYTSTKENITIMEGISRNEIRMETNMTPENVSSGEYLLIRNVLFDFNSFALNDAAKTEIEKLYRAMQAHPQIFVQVTGHTDSKGDVDYNLKLSVKRAQSVVQYLVAKGISKERFISLGIGKQNNIAVNQNPDGSDNPEGRKLNRYVEIKLINNSDQNIQIARIEVPQHLKPKADILYSVLLVQTKDESNIPQSIQDAAKLPQFNLETKINLTETDRARLFFTEDTPDKSKAVAMLNNALDKGFPDARILTQREKEELILSLSDRKDDPGGPYAIQIIALKKPVDLNHFGYPGEVTELKGIDGYYRYVIGNYKDKDLALKNFQEKYQSKFPDAFIIPLSRYQKYQGNVADSIRNKIPIFTIQFSATRKPAEKNKFKSLGDVKVNFGQDGYYRYSVGLFVERSEAELELNRIKTLGFPDAFIRKVVPVTGNIP